MQSKADIEDLFKKFEGLTCLLGYDRLVEYIRKHSLELIKLLDEFAFSLKQSPTGSRVSMDDAVERIEEGLTKYYLSALLIIFHLDERQGVEDMLPLAIQELMDEIDGE